MSPHGWVEIVIDGTTYLFDTEMDMAYRWCVDNSMIYLKEHTIMPFVYVKW